MPITSCLTAIGKAPPCNTARPDRGTGAALLDGGGGELLAGSTVMVSGGDSSTGSGLTTTTSGGMSMCTGSGELRHSFGLGGLLSGEICSANCY